MQKVFILSAILFMVAGVSSVKAQQAGWELHSSYPNQQSVYLYTGLCFSDPNCRVNGYEIMVDGWDYDGNPYGILQFDQSTYTMSCDMMEAVFNTDFTQYAYYTISWLVTYKAGTYATATCDLGPYGVISGTSSGRWPNP